MSTPKPVVLCILDGWGLRDERTANAPALANTPTFDRIMATCPNATLVTHGPDVGLPSEQMGNSEVGHTNIGAGRVVAMDLGQIDLAIEDGTFHDEAAIVAFADKLKASGGTAHLMGVASDGGVHGHLDHIVASAKALTDRGVPVAVHAITDGRDVAPESADRFLPELESKLPNGAMIVTVSGRYFAFDRDNRWDRVERAVGAMQNAEGSKIASPSDALDYEGGVTDEFTVPAVIEGYKGMQDGDGLWCLNFRADRAREILTALVGPVFDGFGRSEKIDWAAAMGMVEYSDALNAHLTTVYPKRKLVNTLGEWVAKQGLRQFRLAETEKYPHVTFFLNGGKEAPEVGEDRNMPKSPRVATYDEQPEMSSVEVTDRFVEAIEAGYDLIVTNYANPDMVGHTGDLKAAMAACEAVDRGLARVVAALEAAGGAMILTADHGNCETMVDPETGGPHTAHTTNLVPVALVGGPKGATLEAGRLADLAPTLLRLMNLDAPSEMTGKCLITS
ncbi:MAG: 2,3-bisphosphoglycerate-independent phosphoglycerate mutase [Paracoccaceae bacterium]